MRYTRQELKENRFQETAADAVHWGMDHRRNLISGIVVVALVAAVIVGGVVYYQYYNTQAETAFGAAMQTSNAPVLPPGQVGSQVTSFATAQDRDIAAKNAFYAVSSKYGSTRSGKYARYMAGLSEVSLGNLKVAEEDFKAVADVHDSGIASLAKFALASVYRNTQRDSEAVAIYKQLIDHPTDSVPKVTAQLELADVYAAKQPDEAKKIYAQIKNDNPKSLANEVAQQRLSALK